MPGDLNGSKSGIEGSEGVGRGTEQVMEGSPNAESKPITSHAQIVRQNSRTPSESSLQQANSSNRSLVDGSSMPYHPDTNNSQGLPSGHSSEERDEPVPVQRVPIERHTGDGLRMGVAGGEPQRAQQHQARPDQILRRRDAGVEALPRVGYVIAITTQPTSHNYIIH